jgi:hypothetical protein
LFVLIELEIFISLFGFVSGKTFGFKLEKTHLIGSALKAYFDTPGNYFHKRGLQLQFLIR